MNTAVNSLRFGWQSRRAWWFTATARTRERFARTALGSFWLGLSNLLSISVLAVVYGTVFKVSDFNAYVVYLGTGLVTWNAIAASVQSAPNLFKNNAANLKNTNTDPIFYTLEEWSFQLQTFLQSFGLVLVILSLFQPTLLPHLFTAGLLPFLNLLLFIYWFPLLICLLGARYEDFFQLVPIVLQLMFLLSPILYKKEALGHLSWTADLNPLYRVLSNLRHALIHGELKLSHTLLILLANLIGLLLAVWLLGRQRHKLPFLV
ncbi:ABC transporter permease [Cyanobium sp. FGCU-6]|jgi:lipopolysaccharide transport system permease protein|nr:ABC transporter permease [Cyanobium sp. FGCU6]